ncbi:MAG: CRISPR-associated endoribonuclease Cas6 [Selenomonadaceae bacterium]|nr:CRISPR-associated endoribonuclease Cas6 [Selenomonadaceae bacterium]
MIGAVNYKLRAENSARLPLINGRLMHAAFFKILHEVSLTLESFVHEKMNIKPFTVSFLDPLKEIPKDNGRWIVKRGEKFFWRVTGLNEEILNAALAVDEGFTIQAGNLILTVYEIDSRIIEDDEFILSVKKMLPANEIEFEFVTPVSFRIDDYDAPFPRPELIFSSLADKWTQSQMPAAVDKKVIRELAAQIRLTEWQGRSKKFYLARDRGTLAFWGIFHYDLKNFDDNIKKVFMLLAKFAEYAGVGRLSGQGFGQTRVKFL